MTLKTRSFSAYRNEKLADPDRAARYLTAAYQESTEAFAKALRNVIQAHSVSVVAKNAGVARESLYRTDNPTLATLRTLLGALGVKIPRFEPLELGKTAAPSNSAPVAISRPRYRHRRGTKGAIVSEAQYKFHFPDAPPLNQEIHAFKDAIPASASKTGQRYNFAQSVINEIGGHLALELMPGFIASQSESLADVFRGTNA